MRLPIYSIRFLASQHFNTDNSLHQCRPVILFLDVRTIRTFICQLYPRHTGGAVRRGSAVVPSFIVVALRKTVKTADLRGGMAATLNMFRHASAVLVPSHHRRAFAVQPPCNREKVEWRPYSGSTAVNV